MQKDNFIFSANQGDGSMEDEDLQARKLRRLNYGKIQCSEEVVCSTGFTADFQGKGLQQGHYNSLKFIV